MAAPKSVTKIKVKNGKSSVEFKDFSEQAEWYLHQLNRRALQDVGNYVAKTWKGLYYSTFHKHSGKGGNATEYTVFANEATQYPRVQIGLKKRNKSHGYRSVKGFYSYFQEFGSSKTPKLGLLQKSVNENIANIVTIESKYLSGLSGEAERLNSQINEEEINGSSDD